MSAVLFIVISMLVIVAVAGLVVTFVAFPHRGEDVPGASWLGDAMTKAVDALPTLDNEPPRRGRGLHSGRRASRGERLTAAARRRGCLIGWPPWVTCST